MTRVSNRAFSGALAPRGFWRLAALTLWGLSSCTSSGTSDAAKVADFSALDDSYTVDAGLDLELRKLILQRDVLEPYGSSVGGAGGRARAEYGAQLSALALRAGDWVAPQRLLDDLARDELRGPMAWAARRASYRETGSARDAYLLGRFENGERAERLFAKAHQLGPELSWARHGYAWLRTRSGDGARGGELEAKAIDRAASLLETVYFERAAALAEAIGGRRDAAEARLENLSAHPRLLPEEAASLRAWAVGSSLHQVSVSVDELLQGSSSKTDGDYFRALALLEAGSGLADSDLAQLCNDIESASFVGRTRGERLRAMLVRLNGREGRIVSELRGVLQLELQGDLFPKLLGTAFSEAQFRAAASLLAGDIGPWLAQWQSGLPRFLGAAFAGESSSGKLSKLHLNKGLVQLAQGTFPKVASPNRESGDVGPLAGLDLLPALVRAGWFDVARVLLAGVESSSTRELRARALAAEELLGELEYLAAEATAEGAELSLDDVLLTIDGLARDAGFLAADAAPLLKSPRIHYGPIAEIVHPGPQYLGHGERPSGVRDGDEVEGLAKLLASVGRMGIVGQQMGNPDIVVRPLLAWEWVTGEHLGAPFEGTVFWCQGVDVPSRYERGGAGIAGAALHEGYWIDVEAVRANWDDWRELRERFPVAGEGLGALVAPACPPGERTRAVPLLGEAQRLAIRMSQDRADDPVDFDEFLRAISVHEEGHLCDRARYLPLGEHLSDALRFLAEVGFSPMGVMRRIEYRAQLVALCEVEDPRLVLFDILAQVEGLEARVSGTGVTPHAAAYQSLLRDLIDVLDEQLADERAGSVGLDPTRYLRWQLFAIGAEPLRRAALELAKREGLVE